MRPLGITRHAVGSFARVILLVAALCTYLVSADDIVWRSIKAAPHARLLEHVAFGFAAVMLGVALLHGAQACRNRPVFIHAGTYWQFDDGVYKPNTFYASAKQALHDLLAYYHRAHTIPSVTLVLYDIFGPGDTRPKLWSKIRDAAPGTLFPVSEGRQFIELVHVSDIARAFLQAAALLLEGVPLEPFHAVRSGVRITLRQLLEQLQRRANLDLTFDWGAIPYWPGQIFEPWHGPLLPGWQPTVDPISGIQAVILERNPAPPTAATE